MTARTRLLGVDFGKARLGLAVSDPERRLASPLTTYARRDRQQDARFLKQVVEEQEVAQIVLGLPVHLDGREGPSAAAARQFGDWLQKAAGVPVVYWDERFTTVEAESALWSAGLTHKRRKERRDRVAAQMLLQNYLDAGCPAETPPGPLEG